MTTSAPVKEVVVIPIERPAPRTLPAPSAEPMPAFPVKVPDKQPVRKADENKSGKILRA